MFLSLHHLRREIIKRTTERLPSISRRVDAPSKIPNLELSIDPKEQVFRFDVPMDNVLVMEIHQRVRHLVDVPRTPSLRERAVLAQLLVELAFARKLEHEKDPLLVVEVAVQSEHIRVSQVLLYLDLPPDLFLHPGLDDLGFVQRLEREDVSRFALGSDHVHSAEFTFSQRTAHVKLVQAPFASG